MHELPTGIEDSPLLTILRLWHLINVKFFKNKFIWAEYFGNVDYPAVSW